MYDWRSLYVSKDAAIIDVLQVIDGGAVGVALVVDAEQKLLGVVTDGDIRRGLLVRIGVDQPVEKIMRKTPCVADINMGREQALVLMREKAIRHLPIVTENNKLVGLHYFDEILEPAQKNNWVVIMAGGLGSRLGSLTENCPKPLLEVGGKPILQSIIEHFSSYGFYKFYVALNYKAEMIRSYFKDGADLGVEIRYLEEDDRLGTAGALSLLPKRMDEPFFVMNGDLLTKVNCQGLLDLHYEHKAKATMCVREYDFEVPYGVVNMKGNNISSIDEKPTHCFFVSAGIYVLDPDIVDHVPNMQHMDMPDLFNLLIAKGLSTTSFPIQEYWLDIGRAEDYKRAGSDYHKVFV